MAVKWKGRREHVRCCKYMPCEYKRSKTHFSAQYKQFALSLEPQYAAVAERDSYIWRVVAPMMEQPPNTIPLHVDGIAPTRAEAQKRAEEIARRLSNVVWTALVTTPKAKRRK